MSDRAKRQANPNATSRRVDSQIADARVFSRATLTWAVPEVKQTGPDLYAYISDNDSSSNSTFLVGKQRYSCCGHRP